jgi:DNA-binding NtrC family response regulator
MIHGAVSQNGGRVEVYSELGHGTSFKIYLPRVSDEEPTPAIVRAQEPPRGHETIMLVEDDDTVRALAARLLGRQGYRVVDFADGPSALNWLSTTPEPIALLLTDVIMPAMNGKTLADAVTAARPGTRVLYASGYTSNVIVQHGVLKPGVEFLAKPFTIAALAERVRAVLDAPPG